VAEVGAEVVVAFRGTMAGELLNWLTNLDFTQVPFSPGSTHRGMTEALDLVWEPIRRHALALLSPGQTLWLTGHSLGGALATLAGARFSHLWEDVRVCTFGTPRVGCPDFVAGYKPPLHRIERVADLICHLPPPPGLLSPLRLALRAALPTQVGWLAPEEVRYLHAGQLTLIDADGSIKWAAEHGEALASLEQRLLPLLSTTLTPAALLSGHQIDGYIACLKAARVGKPVRPKATVPSSSFPKESADMPSSAHISIAVSVVNRTERKLIRIDAVKSWGVFALAPPGSIEPGASAQFRIESNGFMTGADGYVTYQLQGVDGVVKLLFQAPFWGSNHFDGSAPSSFVVDHEGQVGGKHPSVSFTVKPG
jgi:hypothetical protein